VAEDRPRRLFRSSDPLLLVHRRTPQIVDVGSRDLANRSYSRCPYI
jgi:hypothetical protein